MTGLALAQNSQLMLLPEAWELIETFEETATISAVDFHMVGYAARRLGDQLVVTGSSCGWNQNPADTAWFELLERISLVTARSLPPDTRWCLRTVQTALADRFASSKELFAPSPQPELWVPAQSNGVAMGPSWQLAAQHALHEIIERHQILASWYGAIKPERKSLILPSGLSSLHREYRIEHYSMGSFTCENTQVATTASFLWPHDSERPVIYGFGADKQLASALERSLKEALQRLAFLYDDVAPTAPLEFRPSPDYHQEYFLQPSQQELVQGWLAGEHFHPSFAQCVPFSGKPLWVDLTPHTLFPGKVVQVFMPGSLPLMFGRYQPPQFPDLDPCRLIHPIM